VISESDECTSAENNVKVEEELVESMPKWGPSLNGNRDKHDTGLVTCQP